MKTTSFLTLVLSATFSIAAVPSTLLAQAEKKGADHAAHGSVTIPGDAKAILAEIHKHHEEIKTAVASKQLKGIHEHAEVITQLGKALPAKAAADKKARVEGTVKNLTKAADDLHDASDAGDQVKTEANLKKLEGVVGMLDGQFK